MTAARLRIVNLLSLDVGVQFLLLVFQSHRQVGDAPRFPKEIEVISDPLALIQFSDGAKEPVLPFESDRSVLHGSCFAGWRSAGKLGARDNQNRKGDEWLLMFVAGMWFQDLWTYDFRRTEMCIIPYATQMGEISFCAYNTGVGWRQIVENMYQNATVADWYKEHGKHPVYASNRKTVPLPAGSARRRRPCS